VSQERALEGVHPGRDRIRDLGFDPDHLTPEEQSEFLAIQVILSTPRPAPKRRLLSPSI
jgi:hypothetical protein